MQFYLEQEFMVKKKKKYVFHSNKVYIPLILSEWFQITNDTAYIKSGE